MHHVEKAQLEMAQSDACLSHLALPATTRWCSIGQCFTTVIASEKVLHNMVSGHEFICGTAEQKQKCDKIRSNLMRTDFVVLFKGQSHYWHRLASW